MKRLSRLLSIGVAAISALLCLSLIALWVTSHWRGDGVRIVRRYGVEGYPARWAFQSVNARGELLLDYQRRTASEKPPTLVLGPFLTPPPAPQPPIDIQYHHDVNAPIVADALLAADGWDWQLGNLAFVRSSGPRSMGWTIGLPTWLACTLLSLPLAFFVTGRLRRGQ